MKIVLWIIGSFFCFGGLGMLGMKDVFGLLVLAGGALCLPPVRDKFLKTKQTRQIATIFSVVAIFIGMGAGGMVSEQNKLEKETKDWSNVAVPYNEKGYPKLYKRWGNKQIEEVNSTMPLVVNMVAKHDKCDEPVAVELSDNRSKPPKHKVYFVDCKNGERFYVKHEDVKANNATSLVAESDKLGNPVDYIPECEEAVKSRLAFPTTFERRATATSAIKRSGGSIAIAFNPFTYKNVYGLELEGRAICEIDTNGKMTVEIGQ